MKVREMCHDCGDPASVYYWATIPGLRWRTIALCADCSRVANSGRPEFTAVFGPNGRRRYREVSRADFCILQIMED